MTFHHTIAKLTDKLMRGPSRRLARVVPFKPVTLRMDRPVIAFTFDDFPCSAASNAAPALEDAGMRGTFYYSTGLAGKLENGQRIVGPETVAEMAQRGHEIGAHTHTHIDVPRSSARLIRDEIERNKREIATLTGKTPTSFAYPFGRLNLRSKFLLRNQFVGLRGIQPGLNTGFTDLAHLGAQELYDCSSNLQSINALLDAAERNPAWLIFYTHDVKADPTNIGCSPAYFRQIVELVRRRGFVVETVADTLDRLLDAPADRRRTSPPSGFHTKGEPRQVLQRGSTAGH